PGPTNMGGMGATSPQPQSVSTVHRPQRVVPALRMALRRVPRPRGYVAARNGHAYLCACVAPSLEILPLVGLLYQKFPSTASACVGIIAPFHACSGLGFLLQCATDQACQRP